MYSIGQFSLITKTSKKALRHYDEIGLFKPAKVDSENSYRYYKKEQVKQLQTIIDLKSYGLSLVQIKQIINCQSEHEVAIIFKNKLEEIDNIIKKLAKQKEALVKRLNSLFSNDEMTYEQNYNVERATLQAGNIAFIKKQCSFENVGQLIGQLYEMANSSEVRLESEPMIRIHSTDEDDFELEVFAYATPKDDSLLNKKIIITQKCLKTTCLGLEDKPFAYAYLYDYARESGLTVNDFIVEKYQVKQGKMSVDIFIGIN